MERDSAAAIERRIKLRHLQCFLEAVRLRSVVAAADALAISQPAVSKTLRELEEALGAPLFDRSRKGVVLTPFGRTFLHHAGTSVTALRQGIESVVRARAAGEELLRVGVLPTVAAQMMPEALQRFRRACPGVVVRVVDGPNQMLLGQLRVGELDLVLGRLAEPEQMTGLSFEHLYSERIAFAVRPGHPLLSRPVVAVRDIRGYPVIAPPPGAVIRPTVDRLLIAAGIEALPDRIESVSATFGRSFVRRTDAVWIISRGALVQDLEEGVLAELPLESSDSTGPVGLTMRAEVPPTDAGRIFMAMVRDAAREAQGA
ncbi:pca operon transcription factor PcaQ [Inquilinus limosus]|uniref:pca operon transcription factor PcaQ n=1 Tax=Inquilinus limosus TaxID=171674 RepID=UPI003F5CEAD1